MARAKKQAQASTGTIFDHFARVGIMEKEEKETASPDVAALQARIEAQDRLIAEMQKGSGARDFPMVASAPQQTSQAHADPANVKVDLAGLPNRDEDPDGFYREYTTRVNAMAQAQAHAAAQQVREAFERERNADRLWNGFKEAYPKWAPYTSLVETVSNRVANDLQAKGVDLQRLLSGSPERFYQEVEGALKQQYGKLVAEGGEGEEAEDDDPPLDPTDPTLVADIGGSGRPAQPGVNKGKPATREPDMLDDLRAIQRRMGVI